MARTLIENALVVTMDDRRRVLDPGTVLVDGDRIAAVGAPGEPGLAAADAVRIDASGHILIPGLVNTHVHLSQQLGRGLGDDVDLLTWLHDRIWPYESSLTHDDQLISSLLCMAELVRSGVTTFCEAGGQHVDAMGSAVEQAGLRAVLCQSTMDSGEGLPERWVLPTRECLDRQLQQHRRWQGAADGRIRHWFGLRTLFNCSDELVRGTVALARAHGTGINMHLAEVIDEVRFVEARFGETPVAHMARLDALGPDLLAVHTVWLTPRDIDLFVLHDVKVSHNPAAAMRVLGFAPVPEMVAKGLCVTLGTDGAPSNNRMDLIDEMWLAGLIHKGRWLDPTVMPAETILEMATVNGARALAWDDQIGSLAAGKKADLVLIDPRSAGTLPLHDPVAGLVSAMHAANVRSVMIDGRWVLRDGAIATFDEAAVLAEAAERADAVRQRAGIVLPPRFARQR
ncbi:MAG: amidohydrolase [Alphaproteobacteria bacterium]